MKKIILSTLSKLRSRPYSNEYIAEQIENELRLFQNECIFKVAKNNNRMDLEIRAAKQVESIPQSNR